MKRIEDMVANIGACSAEAEWLPTRQTLLNRLKDWEDDRSWTDFFNTYWKLMYQTALCAGLTESEAQEVVQETVLAVAKSMPKFQYDAEKGSFKAWLRNLVRWRIKDQFRRRMGEPRLDMEGDESVADVMECIPDPHTSVWDHYWDREWEKAVVEAALERVKQQVDPKQFQIFDLYVVQQWPMAKIRKTLKVSAGRIYLAKHRVMGRLQAEVEKIEKKFQ